MPFLLLPCLKHKFIQFCLQPNAAGDTPIHVAAREGLLGLAQSLCAFGCAVDVSNSDGLYPLHLAARNGHKELVRFVSLFFNFWKFIEFCEKNGRNVKLHLPK